MDLNARYYTPNQWTSPTCVDDAEQSLRSFASLMGRQLDFSHPPVVETVLSVGFTPIEGLTGAHFGKLWDSLAEEFPSVAERTPYEIPVERLTDGPGIGIEFGFGPFSPRNRYWLISADDSWLLQLQRDWFALNWRMREGSTYDSARYDIRRDRFVDYFNLLTGFLETEKLPGIDPKVCEVTYINHVPYSGDAADDLSNILRFISRPELSPIAEVFESWETSLSVVLTVADSKVGRLHISARPIKLEAGSVWQVNLTARGRPLEPDLEGVLGFMDLGHEAVIVNFERVTTDKMHREWGLLQ